MHIMLLDVRMYNMSYTICIERVVMYMQLDSMTL